MLSGLAASHCRAQLMEAVHPACPHLVARKAVEGLRQHEQQVAHGADRLPRWRDGALRGAERSAAHGSGRERDGVVSGACAGRSAGASGGFPPMRRTGHSRMFEGQSAGAPGSAPSAHLAILDDHRLHGKACQECARLELHQARAVAGRPLHLPSGGGGGAFVTAVTELGHTQSWGVFVLAIGMQRFLAGADHAKRTGNGPHLGEKQHGAVLLLWVLPAVPHAPLHLLANPDGLWGRGRGGGGGGA